MKPKIALLVFYLLLSICVSCVNNDNDNGSGEDRPIETSESEDGNTNENPDSSPAPEPEPETEPEPEPDPTFTEAINSLNATGEYSILIELISESGIDETFFSPTEIETETETEDPPDSPTTGVTFFAPTNKAFEDLSELDLERYRENPDLLKGLLDRHLALQNHDSKSLYELETLVTKTGRTVSVERANNYLWIEGVPLMNLDQKFDGGHIHSIHRFLEY